MSAYRIVFGKACHLPVEIEHRAYWILRKEFQVDQKVLLSNGHQIKLFHEGRTLIVGDMETISLMELALPNDTP
ncbi:hypothetical protein CR513_18820, partial [Mucuna pruriens]